MLDQIFSEVLQIIGNRVNSKSNPASIFLDKNEQPFDIDENIKQKVLEELNVTSWNRYPPADNSLLETLLASYTGLQPGNIAVAPGSAYIITVLLNYLAINQKQIVIAQPSYTLFDYHCKTYGIEYNPWYLNNSLEFDLELLPELSDKSVIILASPNNPVGNTITIDQLEAILQHKSNPLVILDAVYHEFTNTNLNPLINKYDNLIVIRSFSKAFPAAGLRLGYLCGNNIIVSLLKKLVLMYSINQFSRIFARILLSEPGYLQYNENQILLIKAERDYLFQNLRELEKTTGIITRKSEGNFLLLKFPDNYLLNLHINRLNKEGIQVLNTSGLKMLENSIRVSIGTYEENRQFFNCIKSAL